MPVAPGPEACGKLVPGYSDRFYCNFYGVNCMGSVVTSIELAGLGLVIQQLPEAVGNLTSLTHVQLQGNQLLSGHLPQWPALHDLTALGLAGIPETNYGAIPSTWNNLPSLTDLFLANMSISGPLPSLSSSVSMSRITLLDIRFTSTAALPDDWSRLGNITSITLKNIAGLSGGIPASWARGMSQLTAITVSGVPGIIASLDVFSAFNSSLAQMDLSNSSIQGTLPAAWGSELPNLQALNLSNNALSGMQQDSWCRKVTGD
eukprot:GHUV01053231.1.p1 GENE.GHUV01053231.1~~GHUV01053231.1.p1  ORF type:complete len:261 (+),score=46.66 GHUV01053231.1:318-1100(+)